MLREMKLTFAILALALICAVVGEGTVQRNENQMANLKDEISVRMRPILRLALDRLEQERPEAIQTLRDRLLEFENRPQVFSLRSWWDKIWKWITNS